MKQNSDPLFTLKIVGPIEDNILANVCLPNFRRVDNSIVATLSASELESALFKREVVVRLSSEALAGIALHDKTPHDWMRLFCVRQLHERAQRSTEALEELISIVDIGSTRVLREYAATHIDIIIAQDGESLIARVAQFQKYAALAQARKIEISEKAAVKLSALSLMNSSSPFEGQIATAISNSPQLKELLLHASVESFARIERPARRLLLTHQDQEVVNLAIMRLTEVLERDLSRGDIATDISDVVGTRGLAELAVRIDYENWPPFMPPISDFLNSDVATAAKIAQPLASRISSNELSFPPVMEAQVIDGMVRGTGDARDAIVKVLLESVDPYVRGCTARSLLSFVSETRTSDTVMSPQALRNICKMLGDPFYSDYWSRFAPIALNQTFYHSLNGFGEYEPLLSSVRYSNSKGQQLFYDGTSPLDILVGAIKLGREQDFASLREGLKTFTTPFGVEHPFATYAIIYYLFSNSSPEQSSEIVLSVASQRRNPMELRRIAAQYLVNQDYQNWDDNPAVSAFYRTEASLRSSMIRDMVSYPHEWQSEFVRSIRSRLSDLGVEEMSTYADAILARG